MTDNQTYCVRFPLDFFDDARVKVIEDMPHGDTVICLWIRLIFLQAEAIEAAGDGSFVVRCRNATWTDEALSAKTSADVRLVRRCLGVLARLGAFRCEVPAVEEGR